ncbi:complex I subunit 5 family protein [Tepidibacter formicigenes]|jgi:multicomponent Na+:H+ antiporter subunit D|uniref:Multisubunit sodium/proton antiporter, MrpD subunit n=1 Tax=Tepidibacter formicigenes DSM 15518 TaxID=1123349 RepID=A0A1M6NX90_9FIRM|nr:proton-conducting transporter membrane subunit [Tepidibacter formicigenes]SHK00244.1 multisubunit sodium/proton antiporter, MrpD subunit [Tepidibacter formicigenes DSM 15518]
MVVKSFPLIITLMLFISSFFMPLIKNKSTIKAISLLTTFVSSILSFFTFLYVKVNGEFKYKIGHFEAPWGIEFNIGIIETIMSILFTMVCFFVIWYSIYNIENDITEKKVPLYYLLINVLLASLLGMNFTNDIFNAFVFIEVSTLASCGIIIVKDNKETVKATIKYIVLSSLGSGLILMGIAFLYSITGNLNMDFIHSELIKIWMSYKRITLISIGFFTIGLGIKGAMFPLHVWLPDAHSSSPTSSSAILSSLVVKGAVLLLIKVLYRVFGIIIISNIPVLNLILLLGSAGMIMGSVLAIFQKNVKRVIAYSSVAQMGYIFFGIGLGNKLGLAISIFHIIGHGFIKSALFLSVGSMMQKTGKKVSELRGVGKEMPITLGLFTLGALSMVGIPILPGFLSKWNFAIASIQSGKVYLLSIILISSLLNVVYYFPIVINGYFGNENLEGKVYMSKEKSIFELMPIISLMTGMILLGIGSNSIINMILTACEKIM